MSPYKMTLVALIFLFGASSGCFERSEPEVVAQGAIEEAVGPEPQPDLDRYHLLVHFRVEADGPLKLGRVSLRAGPPPPFGYDAKDGVLQLLDSDGKVLAELPVDDPRRHRPYGDESAGGHPHDTVQATSVEAWIGLPYLPGLAAARWIESQKQVTEWDLSGALTKE